MAIGYSLLWDDDNDDLMLVDGSLVLAADDLSVIEWLNCNLGVEEGRYDIYMDTGIGVPLVSLIGAKGSVPIDTILAVLRTRIEETALICPGVESVDSVTLERNGRTAHLHIAVTTTDGETIESEEDIEL